MYGPTYRLTHGPTYGPAYVLYRQNSTLNTLVWGSLMLAQKFNAQTTRNMQPGQQRRQLLVAAGIGKSVGVPTTTATERAQEGLPTYD